MRKVFQTPGHVYLVPGLKLLRDTEPQGS
jgi:hypothetical protein